MGRKSEDVQVPAEWGARDAGKVFRIDEMPAMRAVKWFDRAALLATGSGASLPFDIAGKGMATIAILFGNVALATPLRYADLEPLLDELLGCVTIIRDPSTPDKSTGRTVAHPLLEGDIQEVLTVNWLRSEVLRVHTNFSVADAFWTLISMLQKTPDTPST